MSEIPTPKVGGQIPLSKKFKFVKLTRRLGKNVYSWVIDPKKAEFKGPVVLGDFSDGAQGDSELLNLTGVEVIPVPHQKSL